jgi:membrane-associated protease RseP (regulator of RpoE activity)
MNRFPRLPWCLILLVSISLRADEVRKANETTHQVPYRLTKTQHVLVRAKINGKGPFNFILDTGAPALFVATSVGKQLGLEPDRSGWGTFKTFEIEGGVVLHNAKGRIETPFQLEGMNGFGLAGAPLHGMIGYNILAQFRLEFDFTKDKMAWTELDFRPGVPRGLGGRGGAGALDALGTVMKFLGGLVGKKAEPEWAFRGFLGIEFADKEGGVEITAVLPESPADRAGLKVGDRIQDFQGEEVRTCADMTRLASALTPGKQAKVKTIRGTETKEFKVKISEGL